MELDFMDPVRKECIELLKSLKQKKSFIAIAQDYQEMHKDEVKSYESIQTKFSNILNTRKPNVPISPSMIDFLRKQDQTIQGKSKHDTSIFVYYWSEGQEDNQSEDMLKIAIIRTNLKLLEARNESHCELKYQNHPETISGICHKVAEGQVLNFIFEQGSSFFMSVTINIRDSDTKFYKGTYAATPRGYTCCGIALFEFIKEKGVVVTRLTDIEKEDRIKAELYKKRFLVLSDRSVFRDTSEFKSYDDYNDLELIAAHYIRYRRSATTGKIHGDMIKIEKFGRAIYQGEETENRHGRCFVQKDKDAKNKKAKNLVIELYQESDKEKRGFEFRSPHSFMMFNISTTSDMFTGYTLRPKSGFIPHGSNCFLLKITVPGWKDSDFTPIALEYADDGEIPVTDLNLCRRLHGANIDQKKFREYFSIFKNDPH